MKSSRCPTCKRALSSGPGPGPFGPFCSERCRLADLGAWLSESFRISTSLADEDLDQGLGLDDEGDPSSRRN